MTKKETELVERLVRLAYRACRYDSEDAMEYCYESIEAIEKELFGKKKKEQASSRRPSLYSFMR